MQWFDAFLKYLAEPFLRPLRPKDVRPLNFEDTTSKIWNHFWKCGCQPQKGKADLCMPNSSKVLIYLTLIYKRMSLRNNKKEKEIRTLEPFLRLAAKLSEMITNVLGRNFKIQRPKRLSASTASKMALPNISKIASNH